MYRAVTIALASAFLILAPTELLARGGGGGHGGGGGGGHGGGGGGHGGGGHGGGYGGGHAGFSGGHGGGFGGGRAGFSGGHAGHMHAAPAGRAGFQAMPGSRHGAGFNRHAHRFHNNRRIFIGGDGGYYWGCYPIWNGYAWVNYCGYNY